MKKIIFIMTVSFFMMSCTNKNAEDFRREEVAKRLAQLKSIAGTYRGPMTSNSNDEIAMGYIELILNPEIDPDDASNTVSTETRAVLKGSITHLDKTATQISFSSGNFDDSSGTVVISVPVGDQKIKFYGVISSDKKIINATIQAEGTDPKFGGKVSLKKDGPPVTVDDTSNPVADVMRYEGILTFPKHEDDEDRARRPSKGKVIMSISTPIVDPKVKFYNMLVPTKEVEVALIYIFENGTELAVSTPKGHIDTQFRTLNARFETGNNTDRYTNTLACSGSANDEWKCVITHGRLGPSEGTLRRSNPAPAGVFSRVY